MAERIHTYRIELVWTGDAGAGTAGYDAYGREHLIRAPGKPDIAGSSDPDFRGDAGRWNPEELLVASLSTCHQLWYLGLCSMNRVVVTAYADRAEGTMVEEADGGGRFTSVVLRPEVTISRDSDPERARALHQQAHALCFIARSVNFEVGVEPEIRGA